MAGTVGRLLFPVLTDIYRLDTTGMLADPDGAGPLSSGVDGYGEPILVASPDDAGTYRRLEMAPVRLPVQMATEAYDRQHMMATGDVREGKVSLTFHFRDLEAAHLVDPTTQRPLLKSGDRIGAVYDLDGNLLQAFPAPPGLYIVEASARFGLRGKRNLLIATCMSRKQG